MIAGTAYGVALNDRAEREGLGDEFTHEPYRKAPVAPVLYIKPRNCFVGPRAHVQLDDGEEVVAAATIGLLFGSAATRPDRRNALDHVAAVCLALDVFEPHASFYRPAIKERCRDGFLPMGAFVPFNADVLAHDIETLVDGELTHRWSLRRLVRDCAELVTDVAAFMTLEAGDLLLVGVPGDAPRVRTGARVEVRKVGLPALEITLVGEGA